LLIQALKGYIKKPDVTWLFHIPACWITLLVYGFGTLQSYLFCAKLESRESWRWQWNLKNIAVSISTFTV